MIKTIGGNFYGWDRYQLLWVISLYLVNLVWNLEALGPHANSICLPNSNEMLPSACHVCFKLWMRNFISVMELILKIQPNSHHWKQERIPLLKMLKTLLTNILPLFASVVRNPTHPQILSYSFNNQRNQSLHTPKSLS